MILESLAALCLPRPRSRRFPGPRRLTPGLADADFAGSSFTYGVQRRHELTRQVGGRHARISDSEEDGVAAISRDRPIASGADRLWSMRSAATPTQRSGTGIELDGVRVGAGVEATWHTSSAGRISFTTTTVRRHATKGLGLATAYRSAQTERRPRRGPLFVGMRGVGPKPLRNAAAPA